MVGMYLCYMFYSCAFSWSKVMFLVSVKCMYLLLYVLHVHKKKIKYKKKRFREHCIKTIDMEAYKMTFNTMMKL